MTYSAESFSVWTLKGEELATVPTLQSPNTSAAVSPCGKFVACAGTDNCNTFISCSSLTTHFYCNFFGGWGVHVIGFMSDVKLWEVEFSKNDEFLKVRIIINAGC